MHGYALSKFLPTCGFKWIDPKEFDSNRYTSDSSKVCVLEVDLEYPEESRELHNHYPSATDKIEIKKKMLPSYQLKVADFYNIPIGNVKKLALHYQSLQPYLRLNKTKKTKKSTSYIRI